jgi:protein-tyrosine phosphatase
MIVDAGGLGLEGGGHLAEGRLLRVSGSLVTPADLVTLERLGVRTLVDMRGGSEVRTMLENWTEASSVRYVWLPIDVAGGSTILRAVAESSDDAGAEAQLVALYELILEEHGHQLARAIEVIAEGTPVAFGCAAGKDRTGLVTALLHTLLGVSEDDVVRSYATSPPAADRLRTMLRDHFGATAEVLTLPRLDVLLGAEESTMRATLEYLREHYGSVESYLQAKGLSAGVADRLREDLID